MTGPVGWFRRDTRDYIREDVLGGCSMSVEIVDYHLRQVDQKRKSVIALKELNYTVISAGDSYNDTTMLAEADHGFLFRAPENVIEEYPQFPALDEYSDLMGKIKELL